MKKILLLICLIPAICKAQKVDTINTSKWPIPGYMPDSLAIKFHPVRFYQILEFKDSNYKGITLTLPDSTFEIEGDTMEVIKMLFIQYANVSEKYWAAKDVLDAINLDVLMGLVNKKYFNNLVKKYRKTIAKPKQKNESH